MANLVITDLGHRVFTCGITTTSVDSTGIKVTVGNFRSLQINFDEVDNVVALLQHARDYALALPATPAIVATVAPTTDPTVP